MKEQQRNKRFVSLIDFNSFFISILINLKNKTKQAQTILTTTMQLLTKQTLSLLNAGLNYNREALQAGILHFSVGNFHRAHQCSYYDDLFSAKSDNDGDDKDLKWGIVGASVRGGGSYTEQTRPALKEQNYLYTLVESNSDTTKPKVIGSIIDCLPYKNDHGPIKKMLADESIKIASMTVTEGGYFLNPSTNEFDETADDIQHDIKNPDDPQTVFGLIIQGLKHRKEKGIQPFTVMSCDNVPQNGATARKVTLGLAKLQDEEFAKWIEENVSFPNSMVDRITPAPTDELKDSIDWDYDDESPIFCEPFRQWVVEDNFSNDRPPLDKVGVKFVNDVTPWEDAKLRILNGGHASLSYAAALLGIEFVHKAMDHNVIHKFLDKLQKNEIVPNVPPVPDTDLKEYWETVRHRYQNPILSDRIDRNCENGSDRQPKFILPSIRDCLDDDRCVDGLATVSAMWCKYCMGETEAGDKIDDATDVMWDELHETAMKAKDDSSEWLAMEEVYGDLGQNDKFKDAFDRALKLCLNDGVEAAMQKYIDSN